MRSLDWVLGGFIGVALVGVASCGDSSSASSATPPDADVEDASGGGGDAGASPDAPAGGVTTHGRVVDLVGRPIANAKVASGSRVTTTAADGTFSLEVVAPYELTIAVASTINTIENGTVWVIRGLSRLDPILQMPVAQSLTSATLSGSMPAVADGQGYALFFSPTSGNAYRVAKQYGSGAASSYSNLQPTWQTTTDLKGTMHLFVFDYGAAAFVGHSKAENVTLSAGGSATADIVPPLTSVTTEHIFASMTLPPGYTSGSDLYALVRLPGEAGAMPVTTQQFKTMLDFTVPDLPGATYSVLTRATGIAPDESTVVRRPASLGGTVDMTLPAVATLTAPAPDTVGIDGSNVFTWSGTLGMSTVRLSPDDPETPTIFVTGTETSASLPDLALVGAPMGSGKHYTWIVIGHPAIADADAFTKTASAGWFCVGEAVGVGDDATCTFSTARSFTTK